MINGVRKNQYVINKEFKAKRINEYQKEYIFWHLNGRKGLPPMADKDGNAVFQKDR